MISKVRRNNIILEVARSIHAVQGSFFSFPFSGDVPVAVRRRHVLIGKLVSGQSWIVREWLSRI